MKPGPKNSDKNRRKFNVWLSQKKSDKIFIIWYI